MAEEKLTLADDASVICKEILERHFMPEVKYQHSKVPTLVTNISDLIVQRLTRESSLPRKYIAHVVVVQKNGSGFCSVASCSWNPESDACYVYRAENRAMHCIVTVFGVTM
ncbi:unnamed protein product [Phytomonas sp. Hart1]|nr:unnamed protein product [Phytomonas sp. Hart1]|eukprot:CCW69052.1 unnamed protein product [Phytomonas sp. isolate Hart1]